jgi:hypothetical protein
MPFNQEKSTHAMWRSELPEKCGHLGMRAKGKEASIQRERSIQESSTKGYEAVNLRRVTSPEGEALVTSRYVGCRV